MEKKSNENLVNARVNKTKKLAKILQFIPFIRCIILNGSLADGRTKKSSDIDILIISRTGRVFTVRFIVAVITSALMLKRSSNENLNHAGKFCFNYYLTSDFLEIPHHRAEEVNLYCAKNYSQSTLVWGSEKVFHEYCQINTVWMQKYLKMTKSKLSASAQPTRDGQMTNKISNDQSFNRNTFPVEENWVTKQFPTGNIRGKKVGKWWEKRLSGKLGDWFELQTKKIQIWMIEKDGRTWQYPDYIVYNDRELRFHPPRDRNIKLQITNDK